MIIRLEDIETFPAHIVLEGVLESSQVYYESVTAAQNVMADIAIQKSSEEYFCQGKVSAEVTLECARCLSVFKRQIANDVDFIICDKQHYEATAREGLDDEDYVFIEGPGKTVDISGIVRQAILLEVSMKPLCAEDCKGLCSVCKTNLNTGTCNCTRETIDPRWDGLRGLNNN